MSIINEQTQKLMKLNYILFSKFDQRVFFKVVKTADKRQTNNRMYELVDDGFIYPDGTIESINDPIALMELNSSTRFEINEKTTHRLHFYLKINDKRENFEIISDLTYEEITNQENGHRRVLSVAKNKDKEIPFESDEMYFVVIYPNNAVPALVRAYDKSDFDLLNVDDKDAIYNSYLENIDLTRTTIVTTAETQKFEDINVLKFEHDSSVADLTKILSHESFEDGVYVNDELGMKIGADVIIGGENLSEVVRVIEKAKVTPHEVDFDQLQDETLKKLIEMTDEITGSKIETINVRHYQDSWWVIGENEVIKMCALIKNNIALLTSKAISPAFDDKRNVVNIWALDLKDETELLHVNYIEIQGANSMIAGSNKDGLEFHYNIGHRMLKFANWFSTNPLNAVEIIKDVIIDSSIYYFFCNNLQLLDIKGLNGSPFDRLLTIKEDDNEYFLVRGPLGNLIKKKIN